MAIISDRSELTTPADGDLLFISDVSDTTDAATGTDKKITFANVKANIGALQNVVEDTTPQLGGNLDINAKDITDNGNLKYDATNVRLSLGTADNTITIAGATALGVKFTSETEGATNLVDYLAHRHSDTAGFGAHKLMGRSRGTHASQTVVQSGDKLGLIGAIGYDGTDYELAATIDFEVDGTPGNNDMPGRIVFKTTPDGSNTPAEAMRISNDKSVDFSGEVDITVAAAANHPGLVINQNDTTNNPPALKIIDTSANSYYHAEIQNQNGSGNGAGLRLYFNTVTPADLDPIGTVYFDGKDDGGNDTGYADIEVFSTDVTDGTEDGVIRIGVRQGGSFIYPLEVGGNNLSAVNGIGVGHGGTGVVTSRGNYDLQLQTGNATTGSITITDGANGAITLAPNGTGQVYLNGATRIASLTGVLRADTGVVSVDSDVTDIVAAASDTAAGKVELATIAETNTGTDTGRAITPDGLAGSNFGIRYIGVSLNGTTALTTSDKAYFRIPAAYTGMNLVSVAATVGTGASGSSSSGTPTFTVKNVTDNQQMLSTNLTVDANEYTSATAATAAVINATYDDVVTDDLIEVACTVAGTGVTYASITLGFQLP